MKLLFVMHDPPYGTERTYNGMRWAIQMLDADGDNEVKVYMFGDAVIVPAAGQKVPDGYYNLAKMTTSFINKGGELGNCGSCMIARGLTDDRLVLGARRSSMAELAEWTVWADKVINV
ncbi:MAG TPA: DsrE family protein [Streptosporangiaceae bacterium]|nr:DsrE family protein [Streptosporangiaceae bacterium]